jgi:hypothetical protein
MRFKEKTKDDNNKRKAYVYLTETKGLEPHIAAGILGNFQQESGHSLDTGAYNPDDMGSPSFGLAQWREGRLDTLKKRAGKKINTLEGQLDFMIWEFNNTEKRAYKKLQEATTTEEAALAFSKYYERPHKDYAHNDKRVKNAANLYNTYSGEPEVKHVINDDYQKIASEENVQEEVYGPTQQTETPDYTLGIPPNPVQVPYLEPYGEEQEETEEQPSILDQAVTKIDRRKADMATLQKIMKKNEVKYIEPEQRQPQVPEMQDGGDVEDKNFIDNPLFFNKSNNIDPSNPLYNEELNGKQPFKVDETIGNNSENLPSKQEKGTVDLVDKPFKVKRRGREKQPLNLKVQETTAVKRDTRNPLLTPIVEQEYDEFTDPKNMNYHDIINPVVVTHDKLKEKVESKSEFLNPLGMEKIDPKSLKSEEEVAKMQGQLIENGYDLGGYGADGKMGQSTLKAIDKFNNKLSLNDELSIGNFKTPTQVRELQEFLINKGFDLNPNGKFANDGVDGKLGQVTKGALMKYNKKTFGGDKLPYKGIKDGEGFLGNCAEEQCSEYVQNEIWRNLAPDVSRTEWNKTTGLHGNAWEIGENIIKAGGRKVAPEGIAAGDLVTIYTGGGSSYQDQADANGSKTTHTGVIDQVNDDGSYYILHNVHTGNETEGFQGREWRELVKPTGRIDGLRHGSFEVKGIFRPKSDAEGKATNPLRKNVELTIDPDKAESLQEISSFRGNATDKIQTFIKPLNDFKNKEKFSKKFELEESEYQALAQLTIGIMGQESTFGTSPKALAKEPAAKTSWFLNRITDGNFSDSPLMKSDEVSEGPGQLKYNTNFHSDLTEFGINKDNFDEDENAPIASMYKLATDYKKYLKKGYSKKDSIYRAAAVYNASLQGESNGKSREEWAEDYDVDYANKVINYASTVGVKGEDKTYKTVIDDLVLEENVRKWSK